MRDHTHSRPLSFIADLLGNVGGWIVQHLLERGEDPQAIRIMDMRQSKRAIIVNNSVETIITDISDANAVSAAFTAPWPSHIATHPLTVFHTVAYIKPSDRAPDFLPPYLRINVHGTTNILRAAKSAGTTILITTSSASVALKRPAWFIPPWQRYPTNWLQVLPNADPPTALGLDAPLETFFSCYAYSKARAEKLVRDADDPATGFRTGAIRPGHAVYGHGEGNNMSIAYDYLRRGGVPTWIHHVLCNFVSAQNVSLAHLLFEDRLITPRPKPGLRDGGGSGASEKGQSGETDKEVPDIGGNAYAITDPGPPMHYGNFLNVLAQLAHPATPCSFPIIPPLPMLLLAYPVEWYALLRHRLLQKRFVQWRCLQWLGLLLPRLKGDLEMIQPAMLNVSTLHLCYTIERAREELGYRSGLGTLEGLCAQVWEWNAGVEARLKGGEEEVGR